MISRPNTECVKTDLPLLQKLMSWHCQWELINVNGDWVLKNKFTSLFAYVGSSPTVDTQVVGVIDGSHSTRWSIKSTGQPEHFT